LEELFSNLSTTQPATSTNNSILGFLPNAASPFTNHQTNFPPPTTNVNFFNTSSTLPQQQQQQLYTLRTAPPPPLPPQQQQQDLFIPRSLSPVAPPSVTNPFSGFDIFGDLASGTATKPPTKDSFFPAVPPPKTIQQLQMEKQVSKNPR